MYFAGENLNTILHSLVGVREWGYRGNSGFCFDEFNARYGSVHVFLYNCTCPCFFIWLFVCLFVCSLFKLS